jgi:type III restriction enzyme
VEYKGSHLIAEAAEKRAVGELWQRHSNGAGIYVFAIKDDDGRDVRQQIRQKIAIS